MITMEVRNDHNIDSVTVDPGGLEIAVILADRTLALVEHAEPEAGVDRHEL
jgi:hypothetical protein